MSIINIPPGYGTITAAIDSNNLKPITQIAEEVNAALDEIASRQQATDSAAPDLVRDTIDHDKVWANYNAKKAIGLR